jgi:hypothetical protein
MGRRREKELRRRENDRTETETETLRASPVAILRSTHDFSAVFFQQSGDAEVVSLSDAHAAPVRTDRRHHPCAWRKEQTAAWVRD